MYKNSPEIEQAVLQSPAYWRFRRRLMLGSLGMAILATLVGCWLIRSSYLERSHAARTQTQNLARAIEAHVVNSIQFVDIALVNIATGIRTLSPEQRHDPAAMHTLMLASKTAFTDDFWNVYIDADGKGVAASNKLAIEGVDYSDRDYVRAHALQQVSGLFVGEPVFGRLTKRRVFFISRRVEDASGRYLGVVASPIEAQGFARVFDNSRFDRHVTITLFHRNGKIVARAPGFAESFASDMGADYLFKQLATASAGTFETGNSTTGTVQMASFRALSGVPLLVCVSIERAGALQSINDSAVIGAIGVLLMLAVMLITGSLVLGAHKTVIQREILFRELYDASRATEAKLLQSERHLRLITDKLPVLIGYIDQNERFVYANKTYEMMFDVRQADIPGSLVADVIGEQTYALSKENLHNALNGIPIQFERTVMFHGEQRWDAVTYIPDRQDDGSIAGLFVMAENITERKRGEENRLLTSLVYENTSEGMMILSADGAILDVNASFTRLSGFTLAEVSGKHLSEIASNPHDEEFFNNVRRTVALTGQWQGEIWNRHKNGDNYLIAFKLNTVFREDGKPFRRFALFSDITKKKANEDLIWKQANFDALTGLPNRRMFHDKLRMEMRKTDRSHTPMALVFIDLDHFKEINDTLGHAQGDVLLGEAAQRLRACVRASDTVARLGGDEFTIILAELTDPADVARIAELILARMAEPFVLGGDEAYVSASVGITLYPDDGASVDTILKNADQAMYAAKAQGRNCFHYFAPFMQEASQARKSLSEDLRDALGRGQLRVLYQTIVDLRSRRVHKAEALVRWNHPEHGLLHPADFISIAEANGTIVEIGDWVFRQAAQLVQRLQTGASATLQVCVNKSSFQFRDDGSHYRDWLAYLDALGVNGSAIIVEVTEPMLQDAGKHVTDKLLAFRDAGTQVSLDDFGTGHCSLAFLKRYDIDYLKINPAFIANLAPDSFEANLCEAIIVMAHKLNMKVIAEGVETEQQLAILIQAGCDFGQGFLFSRPVEAAQLEEILKTSYHACG